MRDPIMPEYVKTEVLLSEGHLHNISIIVDEVREYTSPEVYDVRRALQIIKKLWEEEEYDGAYINMALGQAGLAPSWDGEGKIFSENFDDGEISGFVRCHRSIKSGISTVEEVSVSGNFYGVRVSLFIEDPIFGRSDMTDEEFSVYAYEKYKAEMLSGGLRSGAMIE